MMQPINAILHPTDFSIPAQLALELACVLARAHGARLVLLHVVPSLPRSNGSEDAAVLRELESTRLDMGPYREEMRERLLHLLLPGLTVHAERHLAEGDVAATILRKTAECGCDLIVLGTHGRTGAARRLMGSVAEKVAREATCPVVIVKTPLAVRELTLEMTNEEMAVIL